MLLITLSSYEFTVFCASVYNVSNKDLYPKSVTKIIYVNKTADLKPIQYDSVVLCNLMSIVEERQYLELIYNEVC